MPQFPNPEGWSPRTAYRSPKSYSVTQDWGVAATGANKRIVGMWVPAEAFRRGTVIRLTGSTRASVTQRLNIGGDATVPNNGVAAVNETTTGSPNHTTFEAVHVTDGMIATFAASVASMGIAGTGGPVADTTVFIQPLNFVEGVTVSSTAPVAYVLEVVPSPANYKRSHEALNK